MPPAEPPGAGLLLARRRRGAEDEPGHPAGAGVPGDRRPRGAGRRAAGHLVVTPSGAPLLRGRAPFLRRLCVMGRSIMP